MGMQTFELDWLAVILRLQWKCNIVDEHGILIYTFAVKGIFDIFSPRNKEECNFFALNP